MLPKFESTDAVTIFDPAIATRNAGDEIISQAVTEHISEVFNHHFIARVPTHERIGLRTYRLAQQSTAVFVGGSNILTSRMMNDRGWRIRLQDTVLINKIVLMAVGWRDYESKPDAYTKLMLNRLLCHDRTHSVRDTHTAEMLNSVGFKNVAVTSCVTMWNLTVEHLGDVPRSKQRNAITTLTRNKRAPSDRIFANALLDAYEKVYVWPQGFDDILYVRDVFGDRAHIIAPTLSAYDAVLTSEPSLDYIGTRLHGGIRALQHKRRVLILSIDNRAAEISKDTGLPTVARDLSRADFIREFERSRITSLHLPVDRIEGWKGQFARSDVQ